MKVYLDDVRSVPDETWTLVKTAGAAIDLLKQGQVVALSLDHDLGTDETGYDVLLWLEEAVAMRGFLAPEEMWVHSANVGAALKMEQAIEQIRGFTVDKSS